MIPSFRLSIAELASAMAFPGNVEAACCVVILNEKSAKSLPNAAFFLQVPLGKLLELDNQPCKSPKISNGT